MTWSADEEYRMRVMSRRGAVLTVRHPATVYGPAALALMFAAGLTTVSLAAGNLDASAMTALALPSGAATAATALSVGARLNRQEEESVVALLVRIGLVWAFFGAAWTLLNAGDDLLREAGGSLRRLADVLSVAGMHAFKGAVAGLMGGVSGGAVATLLCIERRS